MDASEVGTRITTEQPHTAAWKKGGRNEAQMRQEALRRVRIQGEKRRA
jgi:hypothetical protein